MTWFDAEKAEFSNQVALGSGFPEGQILSLNPDNLSIKNSKNFPYNTDDFKKAYEGEKCMEGGEMSEVR